MAVTYTGTDKRLQYLFTHGGGGGGADIWVGTLAEYTQQAAQIADGTTVLITDDEDNYITEYHIYSETEHVIGQWIDGSILYERTFTGTSASNFSTPSVIADCGSGCVIREYEGYIDGKRALNSYLSESARTYTWITADLYRIANYAIGSDNINKPTTCTVRYTKSS